MASPSGGWSRAYRPQLRQPWSWRKLSRKKFVAEMFNWSLAEGYIYLPSWVREIGSMMQVWVSVLYITALYCTVLYCTVLYSMMQVMPLLIIPFVGIIQSCRYFLHGPDNLLEVSRDYLDIIYTTVCSLYLDHLNCSLQSIDHLQSWLAV